VKRDAHGELRSFLERGERLTFAAHNDPVVSVVVVLRRPEIGLRCLRSLAACRTPLEVILVPVISSARAAPFIDRIDNANVVHFRPDSTLAEGADAGARGARGSYLLFLHEAAEVMPGAVEAAASTASGSPEIGAVGGRLLGADDAPLSEAGGIVWRDGALESYGRGGPPLAPQYAFSRDVDFCSAVFLLTPRDRFVELGGFDRELCSLSWKGADYCVRLWKNGWRVVYEPDAVVIDGESDESTTSQIAGPDRARFASLHADWLRTQPAAGTASALQARARPRGQERILVFDDRVPHHALGFGFPRQAELIRALTDLGHFVTVYPLSLTTENWPSVYTDIPRTVEVMTDYGPSRLEEFWAARRGYYGAIIVSRHHNMLRLRRRLGEPSGWGPRVIYDAEAVVALRMIAQKRAAGGTVEAHRLIREELGVAQGVDAVIAVSELDAGLFREAGVRRVIVARHAVAPTPTARSFTERHGILFVGAFDPLSPNADSVRWFANDVLPRVEALLEVRIPFTVVGHDAPKAVRALASETIRVVPDAANLVPFYDAARLFVAPTRFAAGIPLKVVHAAAQGVPIVCTSLLARQLGWSDGTDLLTADTAEAFAAQCASLYMDERRWQTLRSNALTRVLAEYAPDVFSASLQAALGTVSDAH
jgi:GT2 family glycosyltransferase